MKQILSVHIAAGILGLISGYTALFVGKGSRLHRKAGLVFVGAMSVVAVLGLYEAVSRNVAPAVNVTAALLTTNLIVTALATVRPVGSRARSLLFGGMAIALGVGIANTAFVVQTISGRPLHGIPVFPFIMFGSVAFLGFAGDFRVMLSGPFQGAARLARHLWRMTFALFIAALSFFIGQSDEFPAALRIMPLLALPVLAVIVSLFYWLWRVRVRSSLRGLTLRAATRLTVEGAGD